jgi:hypothetical protein
MWKSAGGRGSDACAGGAPLAQSRSTMLRRAAVLGLLLVPPLGVTAQTAGTMTFTISPAPATVIGLSACQGGTSFITSFVFAKSSTQVLPQTGNVYDIYVSGASFTCDTSTTPTVPLLTPAAHVTAVVGAATQTWPQSGTVTPASVLQKAGITSCTTDATLYVCARLLTSTSDSTALGATSGSIAVQVQPPNAPTSVISRPGDTVLHLSWTPPATGVAVDHYKAVVTATRICSTTVTPPCEYASASVHTYDGITQASFDAKGLVNDLPYSVVVYAVSAGGAVSPASDPPVTGVDATPIPVNDFWEQYKQDGGREQGGCATGAGGLLALLGAAAALRRARRQP